MYRSKFISFSGRSKYAVNLLRLVPDSISSPLLKTCQDRSYARAARHHYDRTNGHELLHKASFSDRSLFSFAITSALFGAVGMAGYVRYNDEKRAVTKGEGTREETSAKGPTIGGPFTLIDSKRQIITEQNLLGNWVLLYFGYTSSPDVGPAEVHKMAKAIDVLESKQNVRLLPVFVTIDPLRDSPSQLNAYLREFNSRFVGLSGPVNSIRQMAQEYRVYFRKVEDEGNDYLVESSHNMYLMNPKMELVRCFGTEYSVVDLVEAIANELKKIQL